MAFCNACQRATVAYGELLPSGMVTRCGHDDCRRPIDGSRLPSAESGAVAENPLAPRAPMPPPVPPPAPSTPAPASPQLLESPFGDLANARPGMVLPGQAPRPHPTLPRPFDPQRLQREMERRARESGPSPIEEPYQDREGIWHETCVAPLPRALDLLLPELRERLVEVKRQLEAMDALERERGVLDRMIAAADESAG